MITFLFAWTGAALGAMFMNYILHEPNKQIEQNESNYDD